MVAFDCLSPLAGLLSSLLMSEEANFITCSVLYWFQTRIKRRILRLNFRLVFSLLTFFSVGGIFINLVAIFMP